MASDDFPRNLRLVCSYSRSIADTCRRLGVNRQQFHRYLSGDSRPGLQRLRLISDYFGFEESEMLLDHETFRRLVAVKRPVAGEFSAISERMRDILLLNPDSHERLREYTGYYYNYFCPAEHPGRLMRGFIQVTEDSGFVFSRNIERYPDDPRQTTLKYNGLFVHSGQNVLMFEREASVGKMVWLTVLYARDRDQPSLMPGLTLGVTGTADRGIACYRVILQYLGRDVPLRETLRGCGLYDLDDPRIDPAIRERVRNEMQPEEPAFSFRL
ncbi:hypothetical protein KBTX_02640 [wastewater metagenome]|uniref:HTH cro/C1-type domain-containing protein n=2 Tax=unclassified sequences TaxID=12908 RepID=A0A5B8REG4_9ZZZZ|nr:helix-turn-helix transcriptional regulator [Arhodomonas sp. KWT]QEA06308.1 hypothetical protein KBTEX_02640 [uncultured organism]